MFHSLDPRAGISADCDQQPKRGHIDLDDPATSRNENTARWRLRATGGVEAEPRMDVEHVARVVVDMATFPLDAIVQFMTLMATKMPYIGCGEPRLPQTPCHEGLEERRDYR
jgi:hypothetical protein